jgi:hypothetical protein
MRLLQLKTLQILLYSLHISLRYSIIQESYNYNKIFCNKMVLNTGFFTLLFKKVFIQLKF